MKLPSEIKTALMSCPNHRVEAGTKHIKIYVNDHLVGIMGRKLQSFNRRSTLNIRSQILRAARGEYPRCPSSAN